MPYIYPNPLSAPNGVQPCSFTQAVLLFDRMNRIYEMFGNYINSRNQYYSNSCLMENIEAV